MEIAQYTGNPELLYVGAQAVYATTDLGYIARANKDGSDLKAPMMPSLTTSAFGGTSLAEDGDRLFFVWVDSMIRVAYCSSASCDATITPVGGLSTQYFTVDTTDHRVAWIDYSPKQIWTAPTTGTVSGSSVSSGGLATNAGGARLFYAQGGLFMANGTSLERLPLSGGNFVTATLGNSTLTILGANDTNIFLYDGTSIVFTPLPAGDGGSAHKLVDTSLNPGIDGRFAVDQTNAYWISNGLIQTCQLSNCPSSQKVVTSQPGTTVNDVGLDASAIYWQNTGDGTTSSGTTYFTIWKLAK